MQIVSKALEKSDLWHGWDPLFIKIVIDLLKAVYEGVF